MLEWLDSFLWLTLDDFFVLPPRDATLWMSKDRLRRLVYPYVAASGELIEANTVPWGPHMMVDVYIPHVMMSVSE